MPLVSIIVPAYRVTAYIAGTLESVLAQTFRDFEVIVINDGCPDTANLEQVLAPYLPYIRYVRQSNSGPGGARNAGLAIAKGEYVAFLDGDDQMLPDYLAVQVDYLRRHSDIDAVYGDAELFGEGELCGKRFMEVCPSNGLVTFEALLNEQCVVFIGALTRRSAVDRAGGFDPALRGVEDYDLWLRILQTGGRIQYHRHVLSRYRKHQASLSANDIRMADGQLMIAGKLESSAGLTGRQRQAVQEFRRKITANRQLAAGKLFLKRGDVTGARDALADAAAYFRSPKLVAVVSLLRLAPWAARYWSSKYKPGASSGHHPD